MASTPSAATVWFDRPGRGNSWTNRMNTEYRYLMARLDADPDVRVVVVTGAGQSSAWEPTPRLSGTTPRRTRSTSPPSTWPRTPSQVTASAPNSITTSCGTGGLRVPVIAAINGARAGSPWPSQASRPAVRGGRSEVHHFDSPPRAAGRIWPGLAPAAHGRDHARSRHPSHRPGALAEEMKEIPWLPERCRAGGRALDRAYEAASYVAREVSPASATVAKRQLYAELLRGDVGAAVDDSKQLIGKYMQRPDFAEGVKAMAERRPLGSGRLARKSFRRRLPGIPARRGHHRPLDCPLSRVPPL